MSHQGPRRIPPTNSKARSARSVVGLGTTTFWTCRKSTCVSPMRVFCTSSSLRISRSNGTGDTCTASADETRCVVSWCRITMGLSTATRAQCLAPRATLPATGMTLFSSVSLLPENRIGLFPGAGFWSALVRNSTAWRMWRAPTAWLELTCVCGTTAPPSKWTTILTCAVRSTVLLIQIRHCDRSPVVMQRLCCGVLTVPLPEMKSSKRLTARTRLLARVASWVAILATSLSLAIAWESSRVVARKRALPA